jgi:hypothetical protein
LSNPDRRACAERGCGAKRSAAEQNAAAKAEHSRHLGDDIGQTNVSAYAHGVMGYMTPNIDRIGCYSDQPPLGRKLGLGRTRVGIETGSVVDFPRLLVPRIGQVLAAKRFPLSGPARRSIRVSFAIHAPWPQPPRV